MQYIEYVLQKVLRMYYFLDILIINEMFHPFKYFYSSWKGKVEDAAMRVKA